jgi:serine/threonine-protein kinase
VAVFFPGLRLADRYVLEEPIGSGGMSHVWRAVDDVLGRAVAVKTLDTLSHSDPALRSVIRREARAAASIAHPHVTQVYDYGEAPVEGGGVAPYLVMELLPGENLADRLNHGPLPWQEAVDVCARVAQALTAAHHLGIVHRDIKPANVMLTPSGAKVVDFGIAALTDTPATETSGGKAPLRAGTPAYLAPEILAGGAGTPSSDVYSLGALLHTALAGAPPLAVSTWAEATLAHERGAVPGALTAPGLPYEIRELCARCLSASPPARPTSDEASEVLARWSAPVVPTAGRAPAPRAPAAAASAPTPIPTPTLLERHPAAATVRSAPVRPPVPARAGSRWTVGRSILAVLASGVAVAGLLLVVAATGVFGPSNTGDTGALPVVTTGPATVPPSDPTTPSAAFSAIESTIATALSDGRIDANAARDLADDVRYLRDRFDNGRERDVQRRAENVQKRLNDDVDGGEFDAGVATELTRLLDILIRLTES